MAHHDLATVKTVEHGEASRMPEPKWFWRRWLIYGVTVWALLILSFTVASFLNLAERIVPPGQLAVLGTLGLIIRYSFYTAWMAVVLYGVGATITDVTGFVAAFKTTRKETVTTALPPARASMPGGAVIAGEVGELPPSERILR